MLNNHEKAELKAFKEKVNELIECGMDNRTVGNFVIGFAGGYDSAVADFKATISQELINEIYEYGKSFFE